VLDQSNLLSIFRNVVGKQMLTLFDINIVGKGNHSVNHIQKIKPRAEQVCQELRL